MAETSDEQAAERAVFEARFPMPRDCVWAGNGYSATDYNAWDAHKQINRWEGWQAAIASRAPASPAADDGAVEGEATPLVHEAKRAETFPDAAAVAKLGRIKADALAIFGDPPADTPQEIRDVIEWYHETLMAEVRARE